MDLQLTNASGIGKNSGSENTNGPHPYEMHTQISARNINLVTTHKNVLNNYK
jgi:hypothetical protein